MKTPDPTIPFEWNLALYGWLAVVLAVVLIGVISTVRAHYASTQTKALWVVLEVLFPIFGTAAWFLFGYKSPRRRAAAQASSQ